MVSISFEYNNKITNFNGDNSVDIFKNISDWLYKNEYDFKSESSNSRSVYTRAQIIENNYPISRFHKIQGSSLYIPTTMTGNISVRVKNIILMLKNFGIDEKSIKTEGLPITTTPKIKKFRQIDDDGDLDGFSDTEEELEDDLDQIKPFGKLPQPFDIESELTKAQAQSEEDVLSFKSFRSTEPNERPDELMIFNSYVKNPFGQSICVLGESGAGKSTTVDNILQSSGHVYQYIIPAASTTGLLSQFSPSAGTAGGYITSRLGQMIEKAYNNKDVNYTAVFDECHKTSIIEMINDELLQAISKNRNKGVRFISLDDDTRKLYPSAKEDSRGNVLIPDNFGFIFISSNVRVISGNPDFFNRVDLIELTVEDRKLQSIEDLNQKRVIGREDKKELVNQIKSKKDD